MKRGPKSIRGNWRIYSSVANRNRAIGHLRKRFNYIVGWKDSLGYGLHFAHADWVADGTVYINLR